MSGMKTDGLMGRNASEKEKTKMRERQRRSITTKIFHGLRKHGGYNLPPRSDINDVLRELAREAGFVVESDGTTYRASSSSFLNSSATTTTATNNNNNNVSVDHAFQGSCGIGKRKGSNTPTPTSSFGGGGGGGDCSSTASPNHVAVCYAQAGGSGGSVGGPTSVYLGAGGASSSRNLSSDHDIPVAHYYGIPYCGALGGVSHLSVTANNNTAAAAVAYNPAAAMMVPHQQLYFQEARASNQNTPVGSPQRRPYQSVDPFSGVGGQKDTGAR